MSLSPLPAVAESSPFPDRAVITPWLDPVVDVRGYDPRSAYVERFWLAVLGPSATWLMRRWAAEFDDHPDGYEVELADVARSMGLSVAKGHASPFARSVQRCVMFGVARARSDGWSIRRRLPQVAQRHLTRLPEPVQHAHAEWLRATITLDALERAHTLAAAMLGVGDDPGVVPAQLMAVGVSGPVAEEAFRLASAA